jgi:hypothetical protein
MATGSGGEAALEVRWPPSMDPDYRGYLERGLERAIGSLEAAEASGDARRGKRARRAYDEELRRVRRKVANWEDSLQCAPLVEAVKSLAAKMAQVESEIAEPAADAPKCVVCHSGVDRSSPDVILMGCCGVEIHAACACEWYRRAERFCVHCRVKLSGATNVSIDAAYVAAWNASLGRQRLPPTCVVLSDESYHRTTACKASTRRQGAPQILCEDDGFCRSCADVSVEGDPIHGFVETHMQGRWPEHGAFVRVVRNDGVWQDLRFERFVNAYWSSPYLHMTHGSDEVDETYDVPLVEVKSLRIRKVLDISDIYMAAGCWIRGAEGKRGVAVLPRSAYDFDYEGLVDDAVGPKISMRRCSTGTRELVYLALIDQLAFPNWTEPSPQTRSLAAPKDLAVRGEYTIRSSRSEIIGRGVFLGASRGCALGPRPPVDLLHFIVADRYVRLSASDISRLER